MLCCSRDRAARISSYVRMRTLHEGRGMSREESRTQLATSASGAPRPPPDPFYTLRPHAGNITAVQYLNLGTDGGLASGTGKGQLSLWSLSSKRQIWTESCPTGVVSISTPKDTRSLSVQLRGGIVTLWDLETQQVVSTLTIKNPSFCQLCHFTPSVKGQTSGAYGPQCFAVADNNYGRVNIYDSSVQKLVQTLGVKNEKSRGMCMCVRALCDQTTGVPFVLAGFDDGSVLIWESRKPNTELSSLKLFSEPVMCLAFDEERLSGVCGSPANSLEVFSLSEEKRLLEKKYSVELKNSGVADVSVRQDGKIMVSGGWDGRVRVFGWKKGKPLAILNYHSATVHCVSFAGHQAQLEDSNLMICGSKDERISLWKLY